MVGSCHKQLLDIIVIDRLHTFDTTDRHDAALRKLSARHTFDITKFCHGNDCICHRDQIFHGDVILIVSDGSTSVITIFMH